MLTIKLYQGVKCDPSYQQLCRVDLDQYQPTLTMDNATMAKLANQIRFNSHGTNYLSVYNCNYMLIKDADNTYQTFVTNIDYRNDGTFLVDYQIDYLNTYWNDFKAARLFVNQTTATLDGATGQIDTPTLDHTAPQTLLGRERVNVRKTYLRVYYYDLSHITNGQPELTPPTVNGSLREPVPGVPGNNFGESENTHLTESLSTSDLTYSKLSGKVTGRPVDVGLKSALYESITDLLADPKLFNSDGTSRIVKTALQESYQVDDAAGGISEELTLDFDKFFKKIKVPIKQNPFIKYVLKVGDTVKEIPSRYLSSGQAILSHQYGKEPGSPDLFTLEPTSQDVNGPDEQTFTLDALTRPIVLYGTYAKMFKQKNRLDAEAQTLINNLKVKLAAYGLNVNLQDLNLHTGLNAANLKADTANKYGKIDAGYSNDNANSNAQANFDNAKTNLDTSQEAALQALSNTLSTLLTNTSASNDLALTNMKQEQLVTKSNLDNTQAAIKSNLDLNQSTQLTNLKNGYYTSETQIDMSALNKFFNSGVGAVLSGSMKAAITAICSTVLTGAADLETAHRINDLNYDGTGAEQTPAGALARTKALQKAQTTSTNLNLKVAMDNLLANQATSLSILTRNNDLKIKNTTKTASANYANKKIDFKKEYTVNSNNLKNTQNINNNNYQTQLKQLDNQTAQAKATNLISYQQALTEALNSLNNEGNQLINEINNEINNFNLKLAALFKDTSGDLTLIGDDDNAGEIDSGNRDIFYSVYYQGPAINAENQNLTKQTGLVVNQECALSDLLKQTVQDDNNESYTYVKGNQIVQALANGAKIYV